MISLVVGVVRLGQSVARSAHDPEFRALLTLYGVLLVVGTVFYARVEGWAVLDAMYFCVVTLATIGYGDMAPRTKMGKAFTIVYVLIGAGVFVAVAAKLAVGVIATGYAAKSQDPARRAGKSPENRTE